VSKTNIDKLEPGMVLTEDVRDRRGRLLISAGAEIEAKHLVIFRTWGVNEVSVGNDSSDANSSTTNHAIDPHEVAQMEESLKPRFRFTDLSHPAMRELLRLNAVQRITHGLS
jgi:hypothetical protein